jgi:hypothetical protein
MRVLTVAALIVVALAGGALSGCAGGDAGEQAAAPSESVAVSPSLGVVPPPPSSSAGADSPVGATLTGVPEAGVEPGCVILKHEGQMYLLLGGDKTLLSSGRSVTVTGRTRPDLMTTCQQGTPFEVADVRLA